MAAVELLRRRIVLRYARTIIQRWSTQAHHGALRRRAVALLLVKRNRRMARDALLAFKQNVANARTKESMSHAADVHYKWRVLVHWRRTSQDIRSRREVRNLAVVVSSWLTGSSLCVFVLCCCCCSVWRKSRLHTSDCGCSGCLPTGVSGRPVSKRSACEPSSGSILLFGITDSGDCCLGPSKHGAHSRRLGWVSSHSLRSLML